MRVPQIFLDDFGFSVADSRYDDVLAMFRRELPHCRGRFAVFLEANLLSLCLKDRNVRECLQEADWIFPDGVAAAKLASWQKGSAVERISGPTFLLKACEYGQECHWRHFFYGGTPESLRSLTAKLQTAYPAMEIAGSYAPPFRALTAAEEEELKRRLAAAKPDLLWVGLGGPKQEFWIREKRKDWDVPIALGVGAAFDFHAGTRPWAPGWVRRLGLEWLWRAVSGGRRTFFRNLRCVSTVSWYLCRKRTALKTR